MSDIFVTCPYDPAHRVQRSRIQMHLTKCEKKHPPLNICPYNHTHRYPEHLIRNHVMNCPSKPKLPPWSMEENLDERRLVSILITDNKNKVDNDEECWD